MTNKEKFLALVSEDKSNTMDYLRDRVKNRAQLRESRAIAYKVMDRIEELGWTQKILAEKMEVSPQHINKILKGNENLTLTTLLKLQDILTIPLLASFYEKTFGDLVTLIADSMSQNYVKPLAKIVNIRDYPISTQSNSIRVNTKVVKAPIESYNLQA